MQIIKLPYFILRKLNVRKNVCRFKFERLIYSESGVWEEKFTDETRVKVEAYWKDRVIHVNKKNNEVSGFALNYS